MEQTVLIIEFIEKFKELPIYQDYLLAEKRLLEVADLIDKYREVKQKYIEQKHLRNDQIFMRNWQMINDEFDNNEIIKEYFHCYNKVISELNRLLNLIFKDIVEIKQY